MSMVLASLLILVAAALLVPVGCITTQIAAALLRRRSITVPPASPRSAVIIPAHNEAGSIRRTIACILATRPAGARVLVVADNCTDATAEIASEAGADVIARRDPARRGKGFALHHGLGALAADAPDIVIFVDADCLVDPGTLDTIARLSFASSRPVQARYAMQSPPSAAPLDNVGRFAWTVKTFVRPLGAARLHWPCQLMGTGMAIPWNLLGHVDLASGHLAEDLKLGADLALAGSPPMFCPEVRVTSFFPPGEAGKRSQRTRWEHGHLAVISEYGAPLVTAAIRKRNLPLLAFALDLCVPPLSLLVFAVMATVLASLGLLAATGAAAPLLLSSSAMALLGISIAIAWWRFGRDTLSPRDLVLAPAYCMSRLPSFWRFLFRRQIDWIRTERS